jgi:hypothetical protein
MIKCTNKDTQLRKVNPLIESSTPIKTKNGLVVTKMGNDLLDPKLEDTGPV